MLTDYLDPLRPYFAAIRIAGYVILASFIFVSGCNHGKKGLAECKDVAASQKQAIKELSDANALYASQAREKAEVVAKYQKELKRAQERTQAENKAIERKLENARKKNPDWANQPIPDEYIKLLDTKD